MTQVAGTPKVLIGARQGHITEVEMIKGLRQSGVDIHAAFESTSPHLKTLKAAGVPVRTLDLRSNVDLRNARRIRRWIKDEDFEIVHGLSNRPVANFILASYGLNNKVIAYRGTAGHVSRWDPTCYLKWLNPRIDKIVCLSEAVKIDLAQNGVEERKLTTIYKGHDLQWYADFDPQSAKAMVAQEFSIPPKAILIGMAANMRPVKGADLLLRALIDLPDNVHGLFIGEVRDPTIRKLSADPRLAQRVHFTGFRPDAPRLLGALDINVAPSRAREGLGKSVIEAMVQGIPTVVANVGGLPELVGPHGQENIFSVDNVNSLREKITQLIDNEPKRIAAGQAARRRIEHHFSLQTTVDETLQLYRDLLRIDS